ncbi:hypothetical protein M407DRAFT_58077, partial [Tulasnella calospora MUT 4182]
FQIYIWRLVDQFTIAVSSHDTIEQVKRSIQDRQGTPLYDSEHRLAFEGNTLDEERTLGHYNIEREDTLDLIPPQRGG